MLVLYPDAEEKVLENISFSVKKGETIAFIGSTGSGKSTLINLIPRFYDATEGEILIDGINIKDYNLTKLYDKIGYVPQKAVLFSDSVSNNIAFGEINGEKVGSDEVIKSAKLSSADEFITKMDKGYDSLISESGTNISGGQKQRIAIARAIARNPEFLIFDDSFSALDFKTDKELRETLKSQEKEATKLIVAQRIGTIKDADRIIVLDNGKIVGNGTHKELLKTCKVYQEIAYSQLSKEELEEDA
jgi:ATP-binding cassette, subfamily B, multidrug efflux pump